MSNPSRCSFPPCGRPARSRGLCDGHLQQEYRGESLRTLRARRRNHEKRLCSFLSCERQHYGLGLCSSHLAQRRRGRLLTPIPPREIRGSWLTGAGYRMVIAKGNPEANKRGYALEHRVVMTELLGRPLYPEENVHHINGDRTDNRPDNLELWSTSQPAGQRVEDKLAWAHELIRLYSGKAVLS